jgi:hypothetical protein
MIHPVTRRTNARPAKRKRSESGNCLNVDFAVPM